MKKSSYPPLGRDIQKTIAVERNFYLGNFEETTKYDEANIEHFGVLRFTDSQKPDCKLWVMYYCKQSKIAETIDRIQAKYGKKNVYEIVRKPIFSGDCICANVKKHFSELKWITDGNLLEAPKSSHFNDERMAKTVTDLCNSEHKRLINYVSMKHHWFKYDENQKIYNAWMYRYSQWNLNRHWNKKYNSNPVNAERKLSTKRK